MPGLSGIIWRVWGHLSPPRLSQKVSHPQTNAPQKRFGPLPPFHDRGFLPQPPSRGPEERRPCTPQTHLAIGYAGGTTTHRTTYALAGQAIAIRVTGDPKPANNGLFYVYGDHLGSATVLNKGGTKVTGSETYYAPFGGYRNAPTTNPAISDRGYTGHRHNNELGLIYMNARYYVPSIGRFASADTIVPDPAEPQSFNRYAYTLNNPLRYTDPSGHCAVGDTACWSLADELYQRYGWELVGLASNGTWTLEEVQLLWDAAAAIEMWFAREGDGDAVGHMRGALGGTQFAKAGVVGNLVLAGNHHVRGNKVHLLPGFSAGTVIHEVGHVLDNRSGLHFLTALTGGGSADRMARELGFFPNICLNRSRCSDYTSAALEKRLNEGTPSDYAKNGPSEDFADTFMLSVLSPGSLQPIRSDFMSEMGQALTTSVGEFASSPYRALQRSGQGLIAPGNSGGGTLISAAFLY